MDGLAISEAAVKQWSYQHSPTTALDLADKDHSIDALCNTTSISSSERQRGCEFGRSVSGAVC
jgi:hypothetical protein